MKTIIFRVLVIALVFSVFGSLSLRPRSVNALTEEPDKVGQSPAAASREAYMDGYNAGKEAEEARQEEEDAADRGCGCGDSSSR